MNSMLIIFFVALSTAYCSVLPLGVGLAGPLNGGVVLGASPVVASASVLTAPIAAPIAAPIIAPVRTVSSSAVLAGPAGTVVTKNGLGLGLGLGLGGVKLL